MERRSAFEANIPRKDDMRVEATLFVSESIRLEADSLSQLVDACRVPSVRKVVATPDIHVGYGVPIGCVLATSEVIIPAAVGYDINCGMRVLRTNLTARDVDASMLARSIRRDIPLGEGKENIRLSREEFDLVLEAGVPALYEISRKDHPAWDFMDPHEKSDLRNLIEDGGSMEGDPAAVSPRAKERGRNQLGTLGGGNHFIELQEVVSVGDDETAASWGISEGQLLVMIHSGSRGFGHQIGEDYMSLARSRSYGEPHPSSQLCYIPLDRKEGQDYVGAMRAGANLAFANRHAMAALVKKNFFHHCRDAKLELLYDVPHNIAKPETHFGQELWVHRKGATRAFAPSRMSAGCYRETGQPVLIPGSMGSFSYLLAGIEENDRALCSTNHGAGRRMSRTQAAGKVRHRDGKVLREGAITDEEFNRSMEGITLICENRHTIKEEAPQAYKDIDEVIRVVEGAKLAKVVAKMRPLAVLKG
ncbi:MAG TPA: RtcB family protein, partial [Acidobacteriota bacterium]|nr:RtcB family protein [Acidobacteriota bacterium]HQO20048.1 RtcB family protein [Acidobacteriota bacterium]HQQ47438.1 RtcB family protein [Acidobacteriota bacterium]